jgi:pilus assembly protein CpaF
MGLRDRLVGTDGSEPGLVGEGGDVNRYRQMLLEEIDLDELSALTEMQRRARLERIVGHLLTREGPVLSTAERSTMIRRIVDEVLGLGVLEPLLADESITEIMVNGPSDIWIERHGRLERATTRFASEAQLYQTIDRIVARVNRRVDESSPMVDARLPSGERVNIIIPPLALAGPTVTIRRFPQAFTMEELLRLESLNEPIRQLLAALVRARRNVIISGGTGTGKTTLLNALSAFVPVHERIVTIEDAAELQLQQPHVVPLEARPPNIEGKGQVTIRDLVRNSLRMRPDRIIVGEVRGGETLDMLQAMNTGHEGSLATVHANSPEDAIARLETLASMSELDISFEALREQVNSAVDMLIHLYRYADGSRRIGEIAAVASQRREQFRLTPVAVFEPDPLDVGRRVTGSYRFSPLPHALMQGMVTAGERVPPEFLDPAHDRPQPLGRVR